MIWYSVAEACVIIMHYYFRPASNAAFDGLLGELRIETIGLIC